MGKCQHYSLNSERPLPLASAGNQSQLKSAMMVKPAVAMVNEPEWRKNALANTPELRIKFGGKHATETPANFYNTTTVCILNRPERCRNHRFCEREPRAMTNSVIGFCQAAISLLFLFPFDPQPSFFALVVAWVSNFVW